ncbi:MAG: hypothetical protein EOR67_30890 [Mesorhizobium sp.]|uniref:hypothetical protein n=1 Tax=Mesorhizobium sp. TaxID=1871066 RepID=UPI000FE5E72B|nr:hypothetical protein [Mesorhizobium sp.]RWL80653.1 MAG: hypothetical protein EOR67_30890 [Mesorhizobium sp.]
MNVRSDIHWGRSPEEDDGTVLSAMLFAEERGDYSVLKGFMSDFGSRLRNSQDKEVATAYGELEVRSAKSFEYEAKHGRHSLMKWDHPVNVEWVKLGLIKLTPEDRLAFENRNRPPVTV